MVIFMLTLLRVNTFITALSTYDHSYIHCVMAQKILASSDKVYKLISKINDLTLYYLLSERSPFSRVSFVLFETTELELNGYS